MGWVRNAGYTARAAGYGNSDNGNDTCGMHGEDLSVRRKDGPIRSVVENDHTKPRRKAGRCDLTSPPKLHDVANGRPQHHDNDNMAVITIILARHYRALVHN